MHGGRDGILFHRLCDGKMARGRDVQSQSQSMTVFVQKKRKAVFRVHTMRNGLLAKF